MPTYICLFGFVDSFDMPPTCYGLQLKISSAESVVCQKGKNGDDAVLLFEKKKCWQEPKVYMSVLVDQMLAAA